MKQPLHFLQYHNAVPVAISIMLLGAGGAFAATDPQAIYSSSQQVISVDNTYIANKDLSAYTPQIQITGVTEDASNYYIAYTLSTIDVVNYVWRDVSKTETMTVSRAELGDRDLGVYVTVPFRNIIANEIAYLGQVQAKARQKTTQKTVATTYSGLIGKMLTDKTETLPGYTPVVVPPAPPEAEGASAGASGGNQSSSQPGTQTQSAAPSGNPSLKIQLLGNNPAQVPLHSTYVDLGGIVTDAGNDNLGIHTFLNGTEAEQIQIDTSTTSVWTITYKATDPSGNGTSIDRKVYVYDPTVGPPFSESAQTTPPPALPQQTQSAPASSPTSQNSGSSATTAESQSSSSTSTAASTPPADTTTASSTATTTVTTTPDTTPPDTTAATTTATTTDGSSSTASATTTATSTTASGQ